MIYITAAWELDVLDSVLIGTRDPLKWLPGDQFKINGENVDEIWGTIRQLHANSLVAYLGQIQHFYKKFASVGNWQALIEHTPPKGLYFYHLTDRLE